jgi:arylsulfatase A-like enzyme
VGLSSDHGAPELPQTLAELRLTPNAPTATVTYESVVNAAAAALDKVLAGDKKGGKKRVQAFVPPQLFIDFSDLGSSDQKRAMKAVELAVEAIPGIAQVYDMSDDDDEDRYAPLMRGSAFPGRHAPLFVRQEPRVVLMEEKYVGRGTDHGTPYSYDRRVPFLLSGPGVRRGRFAQPVDVRDVAPTLAFLLGVPPPDACEGRPVSSVGD